MLWNRHLVTSELPPAFLSHIVVPRRRPRQVHGDYPQDGRGGPAGARHGKPRHGDLFLRCACCAPRCGARRVKTTEFSVRKTLFNDASKTFLNFAVEAAKKVRAFARRT